MRIAICIRRLFTHAWQVVGLALWLGTGMESLRATDPLQTGFDSPPPQARLRAYWWWLNGHVTKEAITRDLEQMATQGFGGALICDAGGAAQDGNAQVPHGPTFFTPEWRDLYRHALQEAARLGLEMSLNIQSGWNLGGPMVPPEQAPQKLVWSETRLSGPATISQTLPEPQHPPAFYRDVAVLACPIKPTEPATGALDGVKASSAQTSQRPELAVDGQADSFWVSRGTEPGQGPQVDRPEWLQLDFQEPITAAGLRLQGRPGYGPRDCELQVSADAQSWRPVTRFAIPESGLFQTKFDPVAGAHFRLLCLSAFDPWHPDSPRNVQIAEMTLQTPEGTSLPVAGRGRRPLHLWAQKAMHRALSFSAPDTSPLLEVLPPEPGEEDFTTDQVVDLTDRMEKDGTLRCEIPAGEWEILRFGATLNDHCRVSTCSEGWEGYALDPFDAQAFRNYWNHVVEPLIADAGPLAGQTLKYLHTDSWEVEVANWTPNLREEFRKRRGYDLRPFLPVIAGRIVGDRLVSNRFLNDLRRTLGDLAIDHHYTLFKENAHRHGLLIHPESGGPHAVPIDSLQCLGMNDAPMSEFWAWSWRHRVGDVNRFFVKQPASAAHTYGRRLVLAEGFTTIGPHWQETLWDNLKPSFHRAACEGLNLLVWHAFTCSPREMGLPGQEYFAGTHFNPNATWWSKSKPFLTYLNRCQWMLQQGLFVADALYYYGDHVPNFAQLKRSDPAQVLPGYDYDVATEEVLLTRVKVRDGLLVLPDGMSYRLLVLPRRPNISLPVLRKLEQLLHDGATILGPARPRHASSLQDYPSCDQEVARLTEKLWGPPDSNQTSASGRIRQGITTRELLRAQGVPPDFTYTVQNQDHLAVDPAATYLDYIHRRLPDSSNPVDLYFVANQSNLWLKADCTFRVGDQPPELWDPLTGQVRLLPDYVQAEGRTMVPLEFPPYGAWFIVFRQVAQNPPPDQDPPNFPTYRPAHELAGPWTVQFNPSWGGPPSVTFPTLVSWTERPEEGVRFYSGTAIYTKTFDLPTHLASSQQKLTLDLGLARELAQVHLNGQDLGILWSMPFRVDITGWLQPTNNRLEIEVVNFWPNRVIGDASLPPDQRRTQTNIRKLTAQTPLVHSGLLGPVRILETQ